MDRFNGYAPVISSGPYIYTTDLLHLQKGWPVCLQLPAEILHLEFPLKCNWGAWQEMIVGHPDQEFAAFILGGDSQGQNWPGYVTPCTDGRDGRRASEES